jgi:hypothetical protein
VFADYAENTSKEDAVWSVALSRAISITDFSYLRAHTFQQFLLITLRLIMFGNIEMLLNYQAGHLTLLERNGESKL